MRSIQHDFGWKVLKEEDFVGISEDGVDFAVMEKPVIYASFKQALAWVKIRRRYNIKEFHFWKADWSQYLALAAGFNVLWMSIVYWLFICVVKTNLSRALAQELHPGGYAQAEF